MDYVTILQQFINPQTSIADINSAVVQNVKSPLVRDLITGEVVPLYQFVKHELDSGIYCRPLSNGMVYDSFLDDEVSVYDYVASLFDSDACDGEPLLAFAKED